MYGQIHVAFWRIYWRTSIIRERKMQETSCTLKYVVDGLGNKRKGFLRPDHSVKNWHIHHLREMRCVLPEQGLENRLKDL